MRCIDQIVIYGGVIFDYLWATRLCWLGLGSVNTYQDLSQSYLQTFFCFHFHMVLSGFMLSKIELWTFYIRTLFIRTLSLRLGILLRKFNGSKCVRFRMFSLNSEEADIIKLLENIQQKSGFWAIKCTFKEKY